MFPGVWKFTLVTTDLYGNREGNIQFATCTVPRGAVGTVHLDNPLIGRGLGGEYPKAAASDVIEVIRATYGQDTECHYVTEYRYYIPEVHGHSNGDYKRVTHHGVTYYEYEHGSGADYVVDSFQIDKFGGYKKVGNHFEKTFIPNNGNYRVTFRYVEPTPDTPGYWTEWSTTNPHKCGQQTRQTEVCTGNLVDVTQIVKAAVDSGHLNLVFYVDQLKDANTGEVLGSVPGGDPAVGYVKDVHIDYKVSGDPKTITTKEYQTFTTI
jgi:hypothetical protein